MQFGRSLKSCDIILSMVQPANRKLVLKNAKTALEVGNRVGN
jgi:hypothetical protein